MSGLCGILRLDGGPVDSAELERMVARAPYRGCDGIHYHYQPGFGLACLSLDTSPDGTGACCPVIVSNGKVVFGADARLDNRAECLQWQANLPIQRQAQGVAVDSLADSRRPRADSEVMLGTIQHDRVAGPGRLVGDFAYALWDATTLRLRLARDAMGMRSLYYRVEKDRVLWCDRGSDVVVASVPLSFDEPSNAYVLEGISAEFWRLLMSHGSLDRAVQTLLERYQVARTQLEADLAVLAEQMCVEGLLVDRAASPCFAGSVDP